MGHKAHPVGLRLGIHRKWKNNWFFESKNYAKFLQLNFNIENFIKGYMFFLKGKKTLILQTQIVKLATNNLFIFIFYYRYRKKFKKKVFNRKQEILWKSFIKKIFFKNNKKNKIKHKNSLLKNNIYFNLNNFLWMNKNLFINKIQKELIKFKYCIISFKNKIMWLKILVKKKGGTFFIKKFKKYLKKQLFLLKIFKNFFTLLSYTHFYIMQKFFIKYSNNNRIFFKKLLNYFYKKKNFIKIFKYLFWIKNILYKKHFLTNFYKKIYFKKISIKKYILKKKVKVLKFLNKPFPEKFPFKSKYKFIYNKKNKNFYLTLHSATHFSYALKKYFPKKDHNHHTLVKIHHPHTKIKRFLSKITNSKINLILINALSFTKFFYLLENNLKPNTPNFNILGIQRMMINRYKYHAIFIKDFIHIAAITILLKNPQPLVKFIAVQFKRLPKNRKQLKLLKFINQSLFIFCKNRNEIEGFKFLLTGRLNRRRRTHSWKFQKGTLPLQKQENRIEYAYSEGYTRQGLIGLHLWIFYEKNFGKLLKKRLLQYLNYSKYKQFFLNKKKYLKYKSKKILKKRFKKNLNLNNFWAKLKQDVKAKSKKISKK